MNQIFYTSFKRDPKWLNFEHVCEYCPIFGDERRFKRKAELVRHVSLHFPDEARPYKCSFNFCNYSASRKEYLRSHYRTKHGGTKIENGTLVRIREPRESKRKKLPLIVINYYRDFPKMVQNLNISAKNRLILTLKNE